MSSLLKEIEEVRVPLAALIRRIEDAGTQYESKNWRNAMQFLCDAEDRLDVARDMAEMGHLELED